MDATLENFRHVRLGITKRRGAETSQILNSLGNNRLSIFSHINFFIRFEIFSIIKGAFVLGGLGNRKQGVFGEDVCWRNKTHGLGKLLFHTCSKNQSGLLFILPTKKRKFTRELIKIVCFYFHANFLAQVDQTFYHAMIIHVV